MIDTDKVVKLRSILDATEGLYSEKERKRLRMDILYKYLDRLSDLHNMNKGEINKLVMLLEYTIYSLEKSDLKQYNMRFKTLSGHLHKFFDVYYEGELQTMGVGIGIAIGTGIGLAIGSALGNVALGLPIGSGVGISLGVALGTARENQYKKDGKIL